MSANRSKGAKRPLIRPIPEPLETWLPKQKKGTPTFTGAEIAASAIGANAYYQLRHYEIVRPDGIKAPLAGMAGMWVLKKHGTITGIPRPEFVIIVNILRQTLGKADYRTILSILGGHAVRNAVLLQSPYDCPANTRALLQTAAEFDARRNFQNFGTKIREAFYGDY